MRGDFLESELRNVAELEECYRRIAEQVRPSELEENPAAAARAYMMALRGLEHCVELRLKLIREAGRLPEPEEEPLATVDLSRLSDEALEEVEAALVPVAMPVPSAASERAAMPETENVTDGDESCEKRVCAAKRPLRKIPAKRGGRTAKKTVAEGDPPETECRVETPSSG